MQHDLPCKSFEWQVFVERCFQRQKKLLLLFSILCKVFSVFAVINLHSVQWFKTVIKENNYIVNFVSILLCKNVIDKDSQYILQNEKFRFFPSIT